MDENVRVARSALTMRIVLSTMALLAGVLVAVSSAAAGDAGVDASAVHTAPLARLKPCEKECRGCQTLLGPWVAKASHEPSAKERLLLVEAFREYLKGPVCLDDPDTMPIGRIGTDDDPSYVSDRVEGSFTAPGARETLFLMFVAKCGHFAPHSENYGQRLFVVTRGDAIVLAIPNDDGLHTIASTIDVDGDGTSDVLFTGGFTNTGYEVEWGSLRTFAGGGDVELRHFDTGMGDCTGRRTGECSKTIRVRPAVGSAPACFLETMRRKKCDPM